MIGGLMKTSPGHGGTVSPGHGSGGMRIDGPGGMMTGRNGSVGTVLWHGVALALHPGGSGMTLTIIGCGHGGTPMLGLGRGGTQAHGLG